MSTPFTIFIQTAIAATFFASAIAKAADRTSLTPFLESVGVPRAILGVSRMVAPVEALVGLALAAGIVLPASLAAACLSATFCIALLVGHWRGVELPCRCYGRLGTDDDTPFALPRAALLLSASLVLVASLVMHGTPLANSPWRFALTAALGALTGLAMVAAFAMLDHVWSFEQRRVRPAR